MKPIEAWRRGIGKKREKYEADIEIKKIYKQ